MATKENDCNKKGRNSDELHHYSTGRGSVIKTPGRQVFDTIESGGSKDVDISLMTGRPNNKGSESK